MCEPVTILATAAALGTAMTAYGQYQQGQFSKEVGNYNAAVLDQKTEEAKKIGSINEARSRAQTAEVMGAQRAAMGASGLQVDSGSFGDILQDTAKYGELDAQTERSNALKQAWGYQTEAASSRMQGSMSAQAGMLNAGGTLLSGGAQAFGMKYGRSGKVK